MPERVLQKHNCVAALQHHLPYNVLMSLSANEQSDQPVISAQPAADPRRARPQFCRADLIVAMLLATIVLATACGGGGGGGAPSKGNPVAHALAFVNCMRTHGEPNMPDPVAEGRTVHITVGSGSGVDPNSRQFHAAFNACKHLTGVKGSLSEGPTITPADQADYLKGVACMRSHGYPKFPEPVFQGNSVTFHPTTPIDTNAPQYQRALATCDKLIPAGLPYSGRNPSGS
jgi:hypothetical protein